MKKRSLLAFVLSFALILSVCTCAFCGVVVSAADVIPAYSSADHIDVIPSLGFTQVGNVGHEYNSDTGTKLWADIPNGREDNIKSIADAVAGAKKIYASGTLKYTSSAYYANSAAHYPFVPIASITYGSAAESEYLALIMRGKGTAVGLGIVRRTGDNTIANPFFEEFAGITGDNGVSHSFAYSIDTETNCLTMTVDGTKVVSNLDMDTLSNTTFNNYVAGFGKFYASGSLSNYRVYTDKPAAPVINEESQKEILSFLSTGIKDNTTMSLYDYSKYVADNAAVYTKTVVMPSWGYTDYSGPIVALAATDYKADGTDTKDYYLGVYCLGGHGWGIAVANDRNQVGGTYVKYDMAYSDGTMQFPSTGLEIVSKLADGKISVWIDGNLVLNNYSSTEYNITAPVLGACGLNLNGYSLTNTSVWVDNADYGYLGDLNGDMEINILDLVRAKKLSINMDGVSAFNDNVKAFNAEGTIGATELVQMRKYLMGVIDNFDVTPEYGEDTTPAEGLL